MVEHEDEGMCLSCTQQQYLSQRSSWIRDLSVLYVTTAANTRPESQ